MSFDFENVSAAQRLDDYEREETCPCGDHCGAALDDCEQCHGTGRFTRKVIGWKRSKVLAPNVKAFILRRVMKGFDLE